MQIRRPWKMRRCAKRIHSDRGTTRIRSFSTSTGCPARVSPSLRDTRCTCVSTTIAYCPGRRVATAVLERLSRRRAEAPSTYAPPTGSISARTRVSVDSLISGVEVAHTLEPLLRLRRVSSDLDHRLVSLVQAVHLE